jgi:hypothetical protein
MELLLWYDMSAGRIFWEATNKLWSIGTFYAMKEKHTKFYLYSVCL